MKKEYGLWPTSGEIDIMESRGNLHLMKDGVNIGAEQVNIFKKIFSIDFGLL